MRLTCRHSALVRSKQYEDSLGCHNNNNAKSTVWLSTLSVNILLDEYNNDDILQYTRPAQSYSTNRQKQLP